ncbi:MAG: magnesium transporter [Chloroflexota bacterium]|nr:MAG: magnesium transporter [Chloroflexota bacterium]
MSDADATLKTKLDGDAVRAALERRDAATLRRWAEDDAVELANIVSDLPETETIAIADLLGDALTAEVVTELAPSEAADLLERLDPADAADVLEEMAPDDAADVVEEIERDEVEGVLDAMTVEDAAEIRGLMAHSSDSAGGIMTPDFAAVRPDLTIEAAIAVIRRVADEAETVHYVYVTEADGRLRGVLSLRDLLLARSGQSVTAVMNADLVSVRVTADQEEVARLFREQRYMALPVVDQDDRLLGIITADDVRDVMEEEATEDIERLGGSSPLDEPYLHAGVLSIFRKRIVWLAVLLLAQAYTASVLSAFSAELQATVALGFFIPMLVGTGGNVGSQTVTTLIRAMGLDDVRWSDLVTVLWKEFRVSILIGLVAAAAMYGRAELLGVPVGVAAVVGFSACFIVVWAGLVAAVLPLVLRRVGVDPAVVSAPLISTFVDGTGLIIYFGLARWVLSGG